jgi:hypothetical protein
MTECPYSSASIPRLTKMSRCVNVPSAIICQPYVDSAVHAALWLQQQSCNSSGAPNARCLVQPHQAIQLYHIAGNRTSTVSRELGRLQTMRLQES